jgi:hypothetical protein
MNIFSVAIIIRDQLRRPIKKCSKMKIILVFQLSGWISVGYRLIGNIFAGRSKLEVSGHNVTQLKRV